MKQIKIDDETHARLLTLSEFHSLSLKATIEAALNYAAEEFEKNGLKLPAMGSVRDIDRAALVSESQEIAKGGELKYGNWLSKLTPAQEYALKHCIKEHKKIAKDVTKKKNIDAIINL
jgi:hypothetical protein